MTSMKSTTIQISKLPHALNKLITRYPYYDTVHIITDSHIARISSTTIQTTIDSYSDIYEIISKSPSYARIVAKSGDMLFVEEDTFSFHVQHTTFTKLPNVKSKYDKKVKVVKMKSGIVKIIIVGMIEELKFMIKKVFDNQESEVTVYGLVNEETKGIFSFDKYLFKEVPLWVTDYDELTLLVNYGIDGFVKGDAFTSFEVTDDEYGFGLEYHESSKFRPSFTNSTYQ
ncbi:hypothetical protein G210_1896 [Candida maltosa Xu316]|uniref:Uncharacterized protein n=1 Tax=Candida maltosa (strain Xu316) TaxID=1245528 RepID=M3HJY4_CANMX|nr:hypothetical protein G210_1896 [Candida maltosa Xu316]